MKHLRNSIRPGFVAALFAILVIAPLITGCATNDENLSERPWNAPRNWETGLPSGLGEERR
ncbi:MAG: hypothetical protein JNK85_12355 [Verrucomicrobiales bacterium]|nr:hypothetical protein [Verrucomicrobiales bacterium]